MTTYRRRESQAWEEVAAAGVAVAAALAAYYLTRTLLAREPLDAGAHPRRAEPPRGEGSDPGAPRESGA